MTSSDDGYAREGKHSKMPDSMAYHMETVPLDMDDPHRAALEDNPEHAEKISLQTALAVLSLALAYVCPISVGFLCITGIIEQVGMELGDTENITWVVGGWSIASSVSFSVAGSVSDIFGRRNTIIVGQLFAIIGSIIACTAKTTLTLAAGSTVIGFGCGIIFVSYAGVSELLPNKWRGTGIGLTETFLTIPWGVANVLIATLLNTHTAAGWRWCYYIGIIYGVVSLAGTVAFYFPPSRPQLDYEKSRWQEIRELDFIGFALYTAGLTIFLIGLTWAGTTTHAWSAASTIAPIVVGFCTLVACFAYDFTLAKQPFFPLSLFRQVRDYTLLLVVVFVSGMLFYSMSALLPQASLYIFTSDPIQIGIIALPNGFGQMFFGGIATLFMGKIGHLKLQILVCLSLQTVFTALYTVAIPDHKYAYMIFQIFGNGPFALTTLVAYVIAGLNVSLRHLGLASGLIGTFRSAGGSVGNAIFNSILHGIISKKLPAYLIDAGLANGLAPADIPLFIPATIEYAVGVPSVVAFAKIPGVTPELEAAALRAFHEAYAYAFRRVFWSTIPFGVIGIVCACFLKDPSRFLTNHVAVHMEKNVIGHDRAVAVEHARDDTPMAFDEETDERSKA